MRVDQGHRKNHFLPVGYLKHFTNSVGKTYVFDKKAEYRSNEILEKVPSQICFEYDRYLMRFPKGDEITDIETGTYGYFDARFAKTFQALNEWNRKSNIWSREVVWSLEDFVPIQYWRSPVSDAEFAEKLKRARRIDEFGVSVHLKKGAPPSSDPTLHQMILEEPNMSQVLRPILAMSTFDQAHPVNDGLEWRVIDNDTCYPYLTSDNPTLFNEHPTAPEDFRGCVVIPIGSKRTLIRIDKTLGRDIHPKLWQDMTSLHQASRYVLASDKAYLAACVRAYRSLHLETKMHRLRRKVFERYVL